MLRKSPFAMFGLLIFLASDGCLLAAIPGEVLSKMEQAFQENLERFEIPGGVLVVVGPGDELYLRGIGLADLESKRRVDPDRTLFYLASVTKPFTAMAVMQMVEQGLLDRHTDVNRYLQEFQIPATFEKPITLHHLLTHTAGLDDRNIGYVARDAGQVMALGRYLKASLPRRVVEPGKVISYSNHGYGLAGHLVELASGLSYVDYLEQRIFEPLGMRRSTAMAPQDSPFGADLATAYLYNAIEDRMQPHSLGYRNLPPAGSISSTAADMGRFLAAHLNGGGVEGSRVLETATLQHLHRRQFNHHPSLPGITYGFWENTHRGHRYLVHEGGFVGAASLLALFPEQRVGMFAVVNQSTPAPLRAARQILLEHLYPGPADVKPAPPAAQSLGPEDLPGSYILTRYSRHSIEKLVAFDQHLNVEIDDDGHLQLQGRLSSGTRWTPLGNALFREKDSGLELAVLVTEGRATHLAFSLPRNGFPAAFEKAGWRDAPSLHLPLLLTAAGAFLTAFTLWPLWGLVSRWWRKDRNQGSRVPGVASLSAGVFGLLLLVLLAGLDGLLGNSTYRVRLIYGMTWEMVALLWIGIVLAGLALLMLVWCVLLWRQRRGSLLTRIYYSFLTLSAAYVVFFLENWNLLGFWY